MFFQTEEETEAIERLIPVVGEKITSRKSDFQVYAALLACYTNLGLYDFTSGFSNNRDSAINNDFHSLIDIQIENQKIEAEISSEIKTFSVINIADDPWIIAHKVQAI